jgi:hypothetical protein
MTLTTHGHHIPNTSTENEPKNIPKARCGGPGTCNQCSRESTYHQHIHGSEAEE